ESRKLCLTSPRAERAQQHHDLYRQAQNEGPGRAGKPQGWSAEPAEDQHIAQQDVDEVGNDHSSERHLRSMDAVEKPAQRADRYRQVDPPQAHVEVRDLQRDYLGPVTAQREKPRRRWPQSKAGNADCDAQLEPLPSKGCPYMRSTAAQVLGGK